MKPQQQALQPVLPQAAFVKPDVSNKEQVLNDIIQYLMRLNRALEIELTKRAPDAQTKPLLYLASPNGSIYQIKVDDAGALSTTLILSP